MENKKNKYQVQFHERERERRERETLGRLLRLIFGGGWTEVGGGGGETVPYSWAGRGACPPLATRFTSLALILSCGSTCAAVDIIIWCRFFSFFSPKRQRLICYISLLTISTFDRYGLSVLDVDFVLENFTAKYRWLLLQIYRCLQFYIFLTQSHVEYRKTLVHCLGNGVSVPIHAWRNF